MDHWQFKLEAQRLLASAVGSNDDHRQDPDEEWEAWLAERNAYMDAQRRWRQRFFLICTVLLAIGSPVAWYVGANYGNRIRAEINYNSLKTATAICANQRDMLENIPVGDYRIVAVLGEGTLADCKWMTDEQYAELKTRPGFRQLTPD